ncbi:MAG: 16S rRNA (guanine(966)-N(2))-methyltransferase RsmD [Thermoanaerobaculia bacterium]
MSSLRITAGTLRGRRIPMPRGGVRPTSERARQAFFDILGARVEGARFLDLFAGSGIFSFEAVSRGAVAAVAVDVSRRNTAAIARHATELEVPVRAVTADAIEGIGRLPGEVFDVVYADPPYDYDDYAGLLGAIDEKLQFAEGAVIAVEHRRRTEPFTTERERIRFTRRAEYGEVWISLFSG